MTHASTHPSTYGQRCTATTTTLTWTVVFDIDDYPYIAMSISFNGPDLQPTYQAIIDGSADYDWALFNQTANELKVQATGSGLDELEEEFMDGRWAIV